MNTERIIVLTSAVSLIMIVFTFCLANLNASSGTTVSLCRAHGGVSQAQGIGNGPVEQLGVECNDGKGFKVTVR